MEWSLARPDEVRGVGFLRARISGLRETKRLFRPFAPAHVRGPGRLEVEIVGVKAEDPQQPREARDVAVDDPLQVGHPASAPVLEALAGQEACPDEHVHGRDDIPGLQKAFHGARDAWVQRILAVTRSREFSRRHMGRLPRTTRREQGARCAGVASRRFATCTCRARARSSLLMDAHRIVGLSEETTCYVSTDYFAATDRFADFVVHEAAHIFHKCKRRTIGLPDERVEIDEYLDILREAVNARNGWKRIRERCAPFRRRRGSPAVAAPSAPTMIAGARRAVPAPAPSCGPDHLDRSGSPRPR